MTRLVATCAVALGILGCGSSGAPLDSGPVGSDAGGGDSGADAAVIADAGPETDAGPGADAGDRDAGSLADGGESDGGSIADASTATVVITDFYAYANCMPIVPPDPIRASWTATVSGATGAAATVTSATLTIMPGAGAATVQDITVSPPAIALVGGTGSADQIKTAASTSPVMACSRLCGSGVTARLDISFSIDGTTVSATATGAFSCAS